MRISDWSSDVCSSDLASDQLGLTMRLGLGEQALEMGTQGFTLLVHGRAAVGECAMPQQGAGQIRFGRSEEHTSELQSLMRISYAVFCLKKKIKKNNTQKQLQHDTRLANT